MMSQKHSQLIIQKTQLWIKTFIVGHNICPFAGREVANDRIQYEVFCGHGIEQSLVELVRLCDALQADPSIETALLIFADGLTDFEQYLDILEIANCLLTEQGYEGIFQLASFHPDYCFEGVARDDASHYTNRSPYPMLHIIREQSLAKALQSHPNPENIPTRNIAYCQQLGVAKLLEIIHNTVSEND